MFAHLHSRIADAIVKLEEKLAIAESDPASATSEADLAKARDALAQGRESLKAAGR